MRRLWILLLLASPAAAQSPAVDAAIAAGQVGERYDGYLGVVSAVSPAVRAQVARINIERRSIYSNFATSRRVSPQDVGITAGCQLLGRVGVGQAYLLSDGSWRRRGVGQPAPVPNYCTGG
ncbi:YdbL family protein [Sphingomonas flavescens]|jgi:uncharacterized protein YdbL (DUF1318 family)|uniref:YdbL family protein n=1 Tax=Sphingomonas flavescens TaxID=3132797 RepID=UPI0028063954|nr:YdbL family protein [Sphingomonas limnosediminicola]